MVSWVQEEGGAGNGRDTCVLRAPGHKHGKRGPAFQGVTGARDRVTALGLSLLTRKVRLITGPSWKWGLKEIIFVTCCTAWQAPSTPQLEAGCYDHHDDYSDSKAEPLSGCQDAAGDWQANWIIRKKQAAQSWFPFLPHSQARSWVLGQIAVTLLLNS